MGGIPPGFPSALRRLWGDAAPRRLMAAVFCVLAAGALASGRISGRLPEAAFQNAPRCESGLAADAAPGDGATDDHDEDDYLYWGGLLTAVNPSLTGGEVYEIGRAVARHSWAYGLPPRLVVAIIAVESSGVSTAVSPKGAQGLMQVMPWWMEALGAQGDLFDIDTNIRLGCRILSENIRRWGRKEGILRYYRGGIAGVGDGYLVKVQKALDGMEG